MTAAAQNPAPAQPAAIISPWVDTFCIGGGSIVFLLGLLLLGGPSWIGADPGLGWWMNPIKAFLTALINMPHFLASYRIIYRSKEMILRYKAATLYIPALILGYSVFAIVMAPQSLVWITLLLLVAGGYLAWHYTGQAWGMMATYAHLSGTPFKRMEVLLIRSGLRIMLAWHVIWFLYEENSNAEARVKLLPLFQFMSVATSMAVVLGLIGLVTYARRTRRFPGVRILVPWVAIFIWYYTMSRQPGAIFWVQIAHGVQYLIFPLRVEMNQTARRGDVTPLQFRGHMIRYALALALIGYLIVEFVPDLSAQFAGNLLNDRAAFAAMMTPLGFLNIHHYFTDGCIWKLRNPEVRQDLFGHLRAG